MNEFRKPALITSHPKKIILSVTVAWVALGAAVVMGGWDDYTFNMQIAYIFNFLFGSLSIAYGFDLYNRASFQKSIAVLCTALEVHPDLINELRRLAWSDGKIVLAILTPWILISGATIYKIITQGLSLADAMIPVIGTLILIGSAAIVIREFRIKA